MPADADVTIGELSRALTRMDSRMTSQFAEVNRRLDGLQFVSQDAYRVQVASMERRIEELEESRKWTARTLVLALITPIVSSIITALVVAT